MHGTKHTSTYVGTLHTYCPRPSTLPYSQQGLLADRSQLQEEVRRLREQSEQDAARAAAALEQRSEALSKQAADLAALKEALAKSEAELKAAQLELQLRSRQAAHEEGLTRDVLRQHEIALVGGRWMLGCFARPA